MFKSCNNFTVLARIPLANSFFVISVCLAFSMLSFSAIAGKPDNVTSAEMATIPPYCPYAQSWDQYMVSPESKRWASILGKPFHAIHHYCWAQINMQRALRSGTPESTRMSLYKMVRDDYLYVIQRSTPEFVLLPEMMSRLGEVEVRLSLIREANQSFATARKLKQRVLSKRAWNTVQIHAFCENSFVCSVGTHQRSSQLASRNPSKNRLLKHLRLIVNMFLHLLCQQSRKKIQILMNNLFYECISI